MVSLGDTVEPGVQMHVDERHRRVYKVKLNLYGSFISDHVFESSSNDISLYVRDERAKTCSREHY